MRTKTKGGLGAAALALALTAVLVIPPLAAHADEVAPDETNVSEEVVSEEVITEEVVETTEENTTEETVVEEVTEEEAQQAPSALRVVQQAEANDDLIGEVGEMLPWSAATNQTSYWADWCPAGSYFYKHGGTSDHGTITDGGKTVTLKPFGADWPGDGYGLLVVKGGSLWNNVIVDPVAGVAYASPLNDAGKQSNVSHYILCKSVTPDEPEEVTPTLQFTPGTCQATGTVDPTVSDDYTWTPSGPASARIYTASPVGDVTLTQTVFGPYDLRQTDWKDPACQPEFNFVEQCTADGLSVELSYTNNSKWPRWPDYSYTGDTKVPTDYGSGLTWNTVKVEPGETKVIWSYTFPEDYNGGTVDVWYQDILGAERDIDTAKVTVTLDTDCADPSEGDYPTVTVIPEYCEHETGGVTGGSITVEGGENINSVTVYDANMVEVADTSDLPDGNYTVVVVFNDGFIAPVADGWTIDENDPAKASTTVTVENTECEPDVEVVTPVLPTFTYCPVTLVLPDDVTKVEASENIYENATAFYEVNEDSVTIHPKPGTEFEESDLYELTEEGTIVIEFPAEKDCPKDDEDPVLASTGSTIAGGAIAAAILAVLAGLWLRRRGTRSIA